MYMSEFIPLSFFKLIQRIEKEYETCKSVFQIPEKYFFRPSEHKDYTSKFHNKLATTPLGSAAGPHTQMTQNILSSWLVGGRIMELKTIQIMDDLKIDRPCIDVSNVCFNVEWSQELSIPQSLREYVKAWYIIEMLRTTNFAGIHDVHRPIFDLSVGYDLKGIQSDKVMYFLNSMKDASTLIEELREELPPEMETWKTLEVPSNISSSVTLSTFHGCPPEEIEKIATYLMQNVGLDTVIKLNPALLGYEQVNKILRDQLGYHELSIPEEAFQNDLQFDRAVQIITKLIKIAKQEGRSLGVKFNNTLVSINQGKRFTNSKYMYMSGRPLHIIAMNLVNKFRNIFGDDLLISFSAGIDSNNFYKAVASNLTPITVCTDMLRSGGYTRVARYWERLDKEMEQVQANNRAEYIIHKYPEYGKHAIEIVLEKEEERTPENIAKFQEKIVNFVGRLNAQAHLKEEMSNPRYTAFENERIHSKVGGVPVQRFDCCQNAPCIQACPLHIHIPKYVDLIQQGKMQEAFDTIVQDNPLPSICGRVCDHPCEKACKQSQHDASVSIRVLKRVAADYAMQNKTDALPESNVEKQQDKVAIIGSGPAGLTAAHYLSLQGYPCTIFESESEPGGLLRYAIPAFRLPKDIVNHEIERIQQQGVEIVCNTLIGKEHKTLESLQEEGFKAIFIATGAYQSRKMNIPGEDAKECFDCLTYLHAVANNEEVALGNNVAIIGGGSAAVDAARVAKRQAKGEVYLIYRRSKEQMPANREEILELELEGIKIYELTMPLQVIVQDDHVQAIECQRTRLDKLGADGRPMPIPVPNSQFQLPIDSVIVAISQDPNVQNLSDLSMETSQNGNLIVQTNQQTNQENIFAGGDVVRGASTIVEAMADGKKAARTIVAYLQEKQIVDVQHAPYERDYEARTPWQYSVQHPEQLPADQRNNFHEIESVLSQEQAMQEAHRCLQCDLQCNNCVEVCPNRAYFTIEVPTEETPYNVLGYKQGNIIPIENAIYQIKNCHQIINLAEICNECGNCENFCPEIGSPYKVKTALFTSLENLQNDTRDGFYIQHMDVQTNVWARYKNLMHRMTISHEQDEATLENAMIRIKIRYSDATILETQAIIPQDNSVLNLEVFHIVRTLLKGLSSVSWL
jgi:putative selenate reductase